MLRTWLRWTLTVSGFFATTLAVAQALPVFGIARFNEAQFGTALPASPVPLLPGWSLLVMAVVLWAIAWRIRAPALKGVTS